MSKLDKETVLAEYEEAYKKAHGKKPKIEASNGWYSVDGGKNVRLAQLAEEAKQLAARSGVQQSNAKASSAKAAGTKAPAKKSAPKKTAAKPAAKKASAKKSSGKGGMTAKELWRKKLEQDATECRLPRGSF